MLTNKNTEQQVCVNKKLKYMLCYAVMLFIATGCSSLPYERNNIKDNIGGSPATPVLNYENRARQYDKVIPYSHFKIYIEIEAPFIVKIPESEPVDKICSIAAIEGTAVYRVKINSKGNIVSSERKLSAGLGLDEIADEILTNIKIEQAWMAGKSFDSVADIRISFITGGEE